MSREQKQDILDFVNFYCTLGIVRLSVLCRNIGVSDRTIQRWNLYGVDDKLSTPVLFFRFYPARFFRFQAKKLFEANGSDFQALLHSIGIRL